MEDIPYPRPGLVEEGLKYYRKDWLDELPS
jgi:hypothetical protein